MSNLEPMPVLLLPHDPRWAERAAREAARLRDALGENLVRVHHIGSTAIPGIEAKPIVDLLPEVRAIEAVELANDAMRALGYGVHGEFGIAGRRYFTWVNPASSQRELHVHVFEQGSEHVARHLAFRDYMRAHPADARAYEAEKRRCRDLHPKDSRAYSEAKSPWIAAAQERALAWGRERRG